MLASSIMDNSMLRTDLCKDLWTGSPNSSRATAKQLGPIAANFYPSPVEEVQSWLPNLSPYNFLLVDDNEINLRIFSRILSKLFPKASVRTVRESTAVETSEAALLHFDIIFLDIEMPIVTGPDIATRVRLLPGLDHVGLVAVTTRCLSSDLELYKRCGFDYTFPKPVENHLHIQAQVEQVLQRRAGV